MPNNKLTTPHTYTGGIDFFYFHVNASQVYKRQMGLIIFQTVFFQSRQKVTRKIEILAEF